MQQIEFPHSTIKYKAPIIYVTFKQDVKLDVKDIKEMISAAEELTGKKMYLLFNDVRNYVVMTPEARKLAADKKGAPLTIASAVLTNSVALKLIANFFVKVHKPHFPQKVFTDRLKAHLWLMSFDPEKDVTKMLDSFLEE
jgi:hypothetical protein